jgi:hypothetical protein
VTHIGCAVAAGDATSLEVTNPHAFTEATNAENDDPKKGRVEMSLYSLGVQTVRVGE